MKRQIGQRGTTLIELSVVIAVLLLLVGVLFIGVSAWRNGANTAACIVNLSSIQKGGPRICKYEPAHCGRRTHDIHFDDLRLLGDSANLPGRRRLHF